MICRRAIGAALAACGTVSRCEDESILAVDSESDSTKADVGRFATTSGVGQRHNVDISRAIAIMERYHAMSLEALHANVDRGKEINVRDQEDGKCPRKDPAILEPISIVQGEPKQRDVKNTPRPKNLLPSRMYTDISDGGDLCVPHVIVGGGTAAWSAVQAIRKRDRAARVLVITEEMYYPYNRTPLSKELWAPNAAGLFTSEWGSRNAVEYTYSAGSESLPLNDGEAVNVDAENISAQDDHSLISIIRNAVVADLDIDEKILTLNNGRRVQYEKLLLATGGVPRSAAGVCEALGREGVRDSVSVFRTLDDFRELRSQLDAVSTSVTVIGAGFLGTELSVAMASEGRNVSLLCAEPGVLYRVLPRYLSEFLSRKLASIGIKVIDGMVVTDARRNAADDSRVVLTVGDGMQSQELEPANKVVVAVGIQPRVELASKAGLEIDRDNGGIVVNHQMNCAADIWAAGDVASFWDRTLGRRRVEHWDHAVVSGRIAGDRMVGGNSRYGLQSMFWSDLENVGVSFWAVGLVQSDLKTVACWNLDAEPFDFAPAASSYRNGIVWYVRDDVVVGAVLWNLKDRKLLRAARDIISAKTRVVDAGDVTEFVDFPKGQYQTVVSTDAVHAGA